MLPPVDIKLLPILAGSQPLELLVLTFLDQKFLETSTLTLEIIQVNRNIPTFKKSVL